MAYVIVKYDQAGGKNLFEVLYNRPITLNDNLNRIILECISYDSDIEADHYDKLKAKEGSGKGTVVFQSSAGVREILFHQWLHEKHPDYVDLDVTFLTTEEFIKIGESANYYRNRFTTD